MDTIVQGMTLKEILTRHGVLAASELRRRIPTLSRAQAWNLWSGKAGVGKETMRLLHDKLGISYEDLMAVDPVPRYQPRRPGQEGRRPPGRPRTSGDEGPADA